MKKAIRMTVLLLIPALALSLTACSSNSKKDDGVALPSATPGIVGSASAEEAPDSMSLKPPIDGELPKDAVRATSEDLKAIAEKFVGRSVEELYEAIGAPTGAEYTPSCLVPGETGEDGVLQYDGFVVDTYRTSQAETVHGVR